MRRDGIFLKELHPVAGPIRFRHYAQSGAGNHDFACASWHPCRHDTSPGETRKERCRRWERNPSRVVRVVRIERRRPVVAVGTDIVEIGIVPVTCGVKERLSADRLTGGGVPPLTFSEDRSPDGPDFIEFTPRSAASAPLRR